MNFVLFGFILICCHVWAIDTDCYLAEKENPNVKNPEFEKFLKWLSCALKDKNDTLGIPVLDPYFAEELPINIDVKGFIELQALFTTFNMVNLAGYDINSGDFSLIPKPYISLSLTWPLINMAIDYEQLSSQIGEFNIFGDKGTINLEAKNILFEANILYTLGTDWKHMKVTEVETKLSLENLNCQIRGIVDENGKDNSFGASWAISNMMPQLIEKKQETITKSLNKIIEDSINDFGSRWTFKQILDMLHFNPFGRIGAIPM